MAFVIHSDLGDFLQKPHQHAQEKFRNLIAINMKKVALSQAHGQYVLDLSGMHVLLQKSWMPPYHNKLKGLGTELVFFFLKETGTFNGALFPISLNLKHSVQMVQLTPLATCSAH